MILETWGENTRRFWEKAAHVRSTRLRGSTWMHGYVALELHEGAVKMLSTFFGGGFYFKRVHRSEVQA